MANIKKLMHLFLHRIILFVGRSLDQLYVHMYTYFNEVTQLSTIPSRVERCQGALLVAIRITLHLLLSTCKFVSEGGKEGGGVGVGGQVDRVEKPPAIEFVGPMQHCVASGRLEGE